MADTPTIPDIAPQQSGAMQSIDPEKYIAELRKQATQPLPNQIQQGSVPMQPNIQKPIQFQKKEMTTPATSQATAVKKSWHDNALRSVSNSIKDITQQVQQRKQDKMTQDATKFLTFQKNIDTAKQVLNDPATTQEQKKMAQSVLETNQKQRTDWIGSDKKVMKEISKMFDISFVDPEKNKTPEVQAGQAAMKKIAEAGPFSANNPQEAMVQKLAQTGGQMQPTSIVGTGGQNKLGSGIQQIQQQQAQQVKPNPNAYIEKAIEAKQTPTLEANPAYAAEIARRDAQEKQINEYLMPKIIEGINQKEKQELENTGKLAQTKEENASKEKIENSKELAETERNRITQQAENDRNSARIYNDWRIAQQKQGLEGIKAATDIYNQTTGSIRQLQKDILTAQTQLVNMDSDKRKKDPNLIKSINANIAQNQQAIKDMQEVQYSASLSMSGNPQGATINSILSPKPVAAAPNPGQQTKPKQPGFLDSVLRVITPQQGQ